MRQTEPVIQSTSRKRKVRNSALKLREGHSLVLAPVDQWFLGATVQLAAQPIDMHLNDVRRPSQSDSHRLSHSILRVTTSPA